MYIFTFFLGPEDSNQKSGQYFCDECDVTFDKSTAYARHLYAHTFIKKVSMHILCKHLHWKGEGVRRLLFLLIFSTNVWFMSYYKCWNCRATWNICFLFIFSWKTLQLNFAFWDTFLLLRFLNWNEIELQSSMGVNCIIFDLIFFQLKIKKKTKIPSSTTISTLRIWHELDKRLLLRKFV